MKIVILGAGRMGSWLVDELSKTHEVSVFDIDPKKLSQPQKYKRLHEINEIKAVNPDLLINAVSLPHTTRAFEEVLPFISKNCLLADIASVKTEAFEYYQKLGRPFISTHPMFGPTFANIQDLHDENVIIIKESDETGKKFFKTFFVNLKLNIFEYSFAEHDEIISYSLGIPFTSSLVFASCIEKTNAPGTTYKKHLAIARGLLSEDDYLLTEIMFNNKVLNQIQRINGELAYLTHIIRAKDADEMKKFLEKLRKNIKN